MRIRPEGGNSLTTESIGSLILLNDQNTSVLTKSFTYCQGSDGAPELVAASSAGACALVASPFGLRTRGGLFPFPFAALQVWQASSASASCSAVLEPEDRAASMRARKVGIWLRMDR